MAAETYELGGLPVLIDNGSGLLPDSYRPFAAGSAHGEPILEVSTTSTAPGAAVGEAQWRTACAYGVFEIYEQAGGYRIEMLSRSGFRHAMQASADFTRCSAYLDEADRDAGQVFSSFVRTAYSQAALAHGRALAHASSVVFDGRAWLFLGASGTGKSTHSRLWLDNVAGARLLNDDNPIIGIDGGVAYAYGSPWSGKTPCYLQEKYPIERIIKLEQWPGNEYRPATAEEAFSILLPSCSSICFDPALLEGLCGVAAAVAAKVEAGHLRCLPDAGAIKCYLSC